MAKDEPLDEKFSYLLQQEIKGYNLRLKKWFDLEVYRISEVDWNVEAFENLLIERKARNLILALVSNQIGAERSTGLIAGKGNGLILLLHGGPGTGKTLTAESVAEIAQKPLYRVTCGDVGTKAEDDEKYLESVLHLGKIWGCVVLLGEADSRPIPTINGCGRTSSGVSSPLVTTRLIRPIFAHHFEDLSKEKMNGRQIRNAITTARQYAEWQSGQSKDGTTKKMTYEHLKDVIEVAGRFDKYLDKPYGGFSVDRLAEDDGLRLA
ncbi:uncharacterized protein A1O5_06040 [Cladophialophora psammophila CBS 110553]|uniref:AAA+ ATPase domain-containing protein n=1 Tax=Cladophialophora psammophila CBS 110553 TaxID=1182543 RepID=W9WS68_9EURO|nr:uncharacterized protein A1O5_06040 [Cladophialophora psammophila CBS 110553]EXJ71047.1 hypothetical protein A1O5_06040 [Cladophialophora psammophila CBS 110553]